MVQKVENEQHKMVALDWIEKFKNRLKDLSELQTEVEDGTNLLQMTEMEALKETIEELRYEVFAYDTAKRLEEISENSHRRKSDYQPASRANHFEVRSIFAERNYRHIWRS